MFLSYRNQPVLNCKLVYWFLWSGNRNILIDLLSMFYSVWEEGLFETPLGLALIINETEVQICLFEWAQSTIMLDGEGNVRFEIFRKGNSL